MSDAKPLLKVNLKDAPLIAAHYMTGPGVSVRVSWPAKLRLAELSAKGKKEQNLEQDLNWIGRQYQALFANKKTKAYAPHIFPYLGRVDAAVQGSKEALAPGLARLAAVPLPYCHKLARSLEQQLALQPGDREDLPELTGPVVHHRKAVTVVRTEPLNELEAILPAFYQASGLAWNTQELAAAELPYAQKEKMYKTLLEKQQLNLNYRLEIVTEPYAMQLLVGHDIPSRLLMQTPTTLHGYKVPPQIADGGMLERSFDKSYELFGRLLETNPELAPVVCLYGHRQRFLVETGFDRLAAALQNPRKPAVVKSLVKSIVEELALKHPLAGTELRRFIEEKRAD